MAPDKLERAVDVDPRHLMLFGPLDTAAAELGASHRQVHGPQIPVAQTFEGHQRFVKSVGPRKRSVVDVAPASHVPLSEMGGSVAGFVESAGDGRRAWIEVVGHIPARVPRPRSEK